MTGTRPRGIPAGRLALAVPASIAPAERMTPALDSSRHGPEAALAALRDEIDAIDDALHDLLMRRADVVARLAASRVKGAAASPLRPGREAAILRRLLHRHSGPLPPAALVRLWRDILFASSAMQGGFAVSLPAGGAALEAAARTHFGTMAVLRHESDAEDALASLAGGGAQAAVLPLPAENGAGAWWTGLECPPFHVVARLPFYAAGARAPQAMLAAHGDPDPSGDDRTLLRLRFDADAPLPEPDADEPPGLMAEAIDPWPSVARPSLSCALRLAGLPARDRLLLHRRGRVAWALAEVDGALGADDPRLRALRVRLPLDEARPLGFYATPVHAAAAAARGD